MRQGFIHIYRGAQSVRGLSSVLFSLPFAQDVARIGIITMHDKSTYITIFFYF